MDLKNYMALLFYLFFILIADSSARSPTDRDAHISVPLRFDPYFGDEYFVKYPADSAVAKDFLLSRLRRGYYYIEEGTITPVNPLDLKRNIQTAHRRQDSFGNDKTETNKPKKLFVPNLFG